MVRPIRIYQVDSISSIYPLLMLLYPYDNLVDLLYRKKFTQGDGKQVMNRNRFIIICLFGFLVFVDN